MITRDNLERGITERRITYQRDPPYLIYLSYMTEQIKVEKVIYPKRQLGGLRPKPRNLGFEVQWNENNTKASFLMAL